MYVQENKENLMRKKEDIATQSNYVGFVCGTFAEIHITKLYILGVKWIDVGR